MLCHSPFFHVTWPQFSIWKAAIIEFGCTGPWLSHLAACSLSQLWQFAKNGLIDGGSIMKFCPKNTWNIFFRLLKQCLQQPPIRSVRIWEFQHVLPQMLLKSLRNVVHFLGERHNFFTAVGWSQSDLGFPDIRAMSESKWYIAMGGFLNSWLIYLVVHPTNRFCGWNNPGDFNGTGGVSPPITGVITHLLSGMNHQVRLIYG